MNSPQSPQTIQNHSGPGDNVAGNKYINQNITSDAIIQQVKNVLQACSHRMFEDAQRLQHVLEEHSNYGQDALDVIKLLKVVVDLHTEKATGNELSIVNDFLRCDVAKQAFYNDLGKSIQLRLIIKDSPETAATYFKKLASPGVYTREVYFEQLADESDIADAFGSENFTLTEQELCGLIRGAIRLGKFHLATEVANSLSKRVKNFNTEVLKLLSELEHFIQSINRKHYLSLSIDEKLVIDEFCRRAANQLSDSKGTDRRTVEIASSLCMYVNGAHDELCDVCWQHIDLIDDCNQQLAIQLRSIFDKSYTGNDKLNQFNQAQRDSHFKRERLKEIFSERAVTPEDAYFVRTFAKKEDIKNWLDSGGDIEHEIPIQKDFSVLELKLELCEESNKQDMQHNVEVFCEVHAAELQTLYQPLLIRFAQKLLNAGLPTCVVDLLRVHIPENRIWLNELVEIYINALEQGKQFAKLDNVLEKIIEVDKQQPFFLRMKAAQLLRLHEYSQAISLLRKSIDINPNSLNTWHFLLHLHRINNSIGTEVNVDLDKIPTSLLASPSDTGHEILKHILTLSTTHFSIVEEALVSWFMMAQAEQAISVSNTYLSLILKPNQAINFSSEVGDCITGVLYTVDDKEVYKLISKDAKSSGCILNAESPLGALLLSMTPNESQMHQMKEITLKQRQPPLVTTAQLAADLREENNDGTDCFGKFSVPEDPEKLIPQMEKRMASLNAYDDEIAHLPEIPIIMKGFVTNKGEPVKGALRHLCSNSTVKLLLANFGVEDPTSFVVDIYSACYLSLIGLVDTLIKKDVKIVMTKETEYCLKTWLKEIQREDYLSIGLNDDGNLTKQTHADISRQTKDLQDGINKILTHGQIVPPNIVDLPPSLSTIEEYVDISVYSSISLSISNDIPWFCFDFLFCQIARAENISTVNAFSLVNNLTEEADLEDKKEALAYHAYTGLPYAVRYKDLVELASSDTESDLAILSELLAKPDDYQSGFASYIDFNVLVATKVIFFAIIDGEFECGLRIHSPRNSGLAEKIFYTCCRNIMQYKTESSETAEYKLASFIYSCFTTFYQFPRGHKIVAILSGMFISSNFLSPEKVNEYITGFVEAETEDHEQT